MRIAEKPHRTLYARRWDEPLSESRHGGPLAHWLVGQRTCVARGVPGLAIGIKSLSDTVMRDFSRVQFTPDLLPADVVGTLVYNQQSQQF